jgi:hypothetical protein
MVRRSQIHGIALLLAAAATQACSGGKDNKCAVLAVPHTAGACYLADGRVALPDGGVLEEDELANAGLPTLDEARGSGKSAAADPVTASDEDAGSIEPSPSGDADAAVGEATDAEPSSAAESPGVDGGADHASDVVVDAAPPPECTQAAGCTAKEPVCKAGECVACAADADCQRYAGTPHCGVSGACVACGADQHCLDPQKPVCGASNA